MTTAISVSLSFLIPLLLLIPLFAFFDITPKKRRQTPPLPSDPNIGELERRLTKLIENNKLKADAAALSQELKTTPTHTVAAYIKLNKKDLKGYHLFQYIFALIKNNAPDEKIIKQLRRALPSAANAHLYALLRSFKLFWQISTKDEEFKRLQPDLNRNRVRTTLLYLERRINDALNRVAHAPASEQQTIIDRAVIYSLIFASFSEFYNNETTEKILRLSYQLSPELFKYWHTVPKDAPLFNRTYEFPRVLRPNDENTSRRRFF